MIHGGSYPWFVRTFRQFPFQASQDILTGFPTQLQFKVGNLMNIYAANQRVHVPGHLLIPLTVKACWGPIIDVLVHPRPQKQVARRHKQKLGGRRGWSMPFDVEQKSMRPSRRRCLTMWNRGSLARAEVGKQLDWAAESLSMSRNGRRFTGAKQESSGGHESASADPHSSHQGDDVHPWYTTQMPLQQGAWVQGMAEWLVVSKDEEPSSSKHEADSGMDRQQLPVEGVVTLLHQCQLPGEEGERSQGGAAKMLEQISDIGVGCVDHQADGIVRLRVLELCSGCQSHLGSSKCLVHSWGPGQSWARQNPGSGECQQKFCCPAQKIAVKVNQTRNRWSSNCVEGHGKMTTAFMWPGSGLMRELRPKPNVQGTWLLPGQKWMMVRPFSHEDAAFGWHDQGLPHGSCWGPRRWRAGLTKLCS